MTASSSAAPPPPPPRRWETRGGGRAGGGAGRCGLDGAPSRLDGLGMRLLPREPARELNPERRGVGVLGQRLSELADRLIEGSRLGVNLSQGEVVVCLGIGRLPRGGHGDRGPRGQCDRRRDGPKRLSTGAARKQETAEEDHLASLHKLGTPGADPAWLSRAFTMRRRRAAPSEGSSMGGKAWSMARASPGERARGGRSAA